MIIVSGGHRDSMPDVVEYSEERQEASGGWNEKLERRLLELEENNIKLEALLEQERNWRIRRTAKRRQTPARKREIKAFLDYFSMVAQLASHRIRDYDACMVTFSRRVHSDECSVCVCVTSVHMLYCLYMYLYLVDLLYYSCQICSQR
jgi:hypothetical protein